MSGASRTGITKQEREHALRTKAPIDIACELYKRGGMTEADFIADLGEHLRAGFVVSNPAFFTMFRAVMLDDGRHAWLINSAVGRSMKEIVTQFPFRLECLAFHRRGGPLRVYEFNKLMPRMLRARTTGLPNL